MSMTIQFEASKIEIVARLAEYLIPLAQQAASAGIPIYDFERGLFGGLLAVGIVHRSVLTCATGILDAVLL